MVESLYHEFKKFRGNPITELATELFLDTSDEDIPRVPKEEKTDNLILGVVWDLYKQFSATALRNLTHVVDSPWGKVYKEGENIVIPSDLIKTYFVERIKIYVDNAKKPTH